MKHWGSPEFMALIRRKHWGPKTPAERFMDKVSPEPNTGCWLWTASIDEMGYARFKLRGRPERASRAAWVLLRGPIPAGMCVLHRCDQRWCVNPDHLFLGTNRDNVADRVRKGRSRRHGQSLTAAFDRRIGRAA